MKEIHRPGDQFSPGRTETTSVVEIGSMDIKITETIAVNELIALRDIVNAAQVVWRNRQRLSLYYSPVWDKLEEALDNYNKLKKPKREAL